jgi:hypothetical protein
MCLVASTLPVRISHFAQGLLLVELSDYFFFRVRLVALFLQALTVFESAPLPVPGLQRLPMELVWRPRLEA